MIRDSALAASGLLVGKLGGPSVKPYQPEGVWEAVAMPESNTRDYRPDHGDRLYRRSLYTFWKRSAPPASLDIFNAPSREVCTVRRERTNTPLQALVTLNDPQFVEAARALAQSALERRRRNRRARASTSSPGGCWPARSAPRSSQSSGRRSPSCSPTTSRHPDDAARLLAVGESKADPALDARHPRRLDHAGQRADEPG